MLLAPPRQRGGGGAASPCPPEAATVTRPLLASVYGNALSLPGFTLSKFRYPRAYSPDDRVLQVADFSRRTGLVPGDDVIVVRTRERPSLIVVERRDKPAELQPYQRRRASRYDWLITSLEFFPKATHLTFSPTLGLHFARNHLRGTQLTLNSLLGTATPASSPLSPRYGFPAVGRQTENSAYRSSRSRIDRAISDSLTLGNGTTTSIQEILLLHTQSLHNPKTALLRERPLATREIETRTVQVPPPPSFDDSMRLPSNPPRMLDTQSAAA